MYGNFLALWAQPSTTELPAVLIFPCFVLLRAQRRHQVTQCKMCPSPAKNPLCLIIKYWMLRLDWVFWHSYYLVLQPTVLYIGYQITHRNNFDIQQFCGLQNTVEPTFSYLNAVCREWPIDILTESIIICEIQRKKIILCVCVFKSVFLVNIWLICGSFISCKAGRDVYCTSSKQEKLAEFYLGILS